MRTITLFYLVLFSFSISLAKPVKELTIEDIYQRFRFVRSIPRSMQWRPDGNALSYFEEDESFGKNRLMLFDVNSLKEEELLPDDELIVKAQSGSIDTIRITNYQWLPSGKGLLIKDQGDLFIYFTDTKITRRLTQTDDFEENVTISPDSRWLSFVRNDNIFLINIATGHEKQLTHDGGNGILNGKLDWVYQEELIGRGNYLAYWWSPDSRKIAFYQIDERYVPTYPLVDMSYLHPEVRFMHYPKAGDQNSIVKIGVIEISDGQIRWLDLGDETEVYYPRTYWLPNSRQLAIMRLDRHQQHLEFLFADAETGQTRLVLEEKDPYWINIGDFVYFFKNKEQFIWGSERSGYQHLYLYDYNGKLLNTLTRGDWAVTALVKVDEEREEVYFTGTRDDIKERHLYRVKTKGGEPRRLTEGHGIHSIRFSPNARFYIKHFSSTLFPGQITLHSANGKKLRDLRKSDLSQLEEYELVEPEFLKVKGKNGISYDAMMIKPPHFDPGKKYPVLIYVYGGPHSQLVIKRFTNLWHQMLAQKGYIIFTLDNRGTANRGRDWETAIYKHLGKLELEDQLQGVEYLKSLRYVDANRIGIWGWSYGGYMVLNALVNSDAFKVGLSVAPVTDWRYYDTIYTERYMSLPSENEDGYYTSSPINFVENLKAKLFIAHGTADDNVHFQNTQRFINRLIDAGKPYVLYIYPDQKHSISSIRDRIHLFKAMTNFILENL